MKASRLLLSLPRGQLFRVINTVVWFGLGIMSLLDGIYVLAFPSLAVVAVGVDAFLLHRLNLILRSQDHGYWHRLALQQSGEIAFLQRRVDELEQQQREV